MNASRRAALLCALALGGCAAVDAHSYDRSAGWRAAEVIAVGRADRLGPGVERDCGPGADPANYAVLRYRNGGVHSRSLGTGRLPPGVPLQAGDTVYVNVLDCKVALAPPTAPAQR